MARIPEREEVYQSWLYVRQLEIKLELAKAAHEDLFNMRYVTGGMPRDEPGAPPTLGELVASDATRPVK